MKTHVYINYFSKKSIYIVQGMFQCFISTLFRNYYEISNLINVCMQYIISFQIIRPYNSIESSKKTKNKMFTQTALLFSSSFRVFRATIGMRFTLDDCHQHLIFDIVLRTQLIIRRTHEPTFERSKNGPVARFVHIFLVPLTVHYVRYGVFD